VDDAKAICNYTLVRLGHSLITEDANPPNLTSATDEADMFNLIYEDKRDALLAGFPWSFAIERDAWTPTWQSLTNITQADPGVVTLAGHGYSDGQWLYFKDVEGMTEINGQSLRVNNAAANTFELQDKYGNFDTSGYTAYTAGGEVRMTAAFDYDYVYDISSYAGVWKVVYPYKAPWEVNRNKLLINSDEIYVVVIRKITDVTEYPASFKIALALFMALEFTKRLTADHKMYEIVLNDFIDSLQEAYRKDILQDEEDRDKVKERLSPWQQAGHPWEDRVSSGIGISGKKFIEDYVI